jgi:hypothetical protein
MLLKTELPEIYRKVMAFLAIIMPLAMVVVWVLWGQEWSFLWLVGAIVSLEIFVAILSLLNTKRIPLQTLENTQQHIEAVHGKVGLAMAVVGLIGVFVGKDLYTKIVCAIGVVFFGLGGIYMINKKKTHVK